MHRPAIIATCGAGLLAIACLRPSAAIAAYSQADLAGPWRSAAIASGPGAPWWERAFVQVAANGDFTAAALSNFGEADTVQGSLLLDPEGIATTSLSGTFRGALDIGRTVLAATDTWSTDEAGTTELRVVLKSVGGVSLAELAGDWEVNSIASGPGAPWWLRGRLAIAPDGGLAGDLTDISEAADPVSGALAVAPDGSLAFSFAPGAQGWVDAGHTVLVLTNSWADGVPGTAELAILLKLAPAYVQSDLAGTWEVQGLATGPGAPWWSRARITVAADGSFSGTETGSTGGSQPIGGTLALSPDGVVTPVGAPNARGALDAGRSVMVWTDTWSSGSPGTSEIRVGVRTGGSVAAVEGPVAAALALAPVSPNPARGRSLAVRFTLSRAGEAHLELLDVAGRVVATGDRFGLEAGTHRIELPLDEDAAPGLYFVRLHQGREERVARVTLLR